MVKAIQKKRLLWVVPEVKDGGIRTYSQALWPSIKESWRSRGFETLEPYFLDEKEFPKLLDYLKKERPTYIHFQHEYGLFGGKNPLRYSFPKWVSKIRDILPEAYLSATAHTVLDPDFRYAWRGWSPQDQVKWWGNFTWLPFVRGMWMKKTWGVLDGVVVHSSYQQPAVIKSDCHHVEVIPHFVFDPKQAMGGVPVPRNRHPILEQSKDASLVMVFGFFTPEKGQDVAIRAWAESPLRERGNVRLILAGGVRRPEDRPYYDQCVKLIQDLGLSDRVQITGFLPADSMDSFFEACKLVLAPFRATSGSGSLAQALARGTPILASDLLLNREIVEREPGALSFFESLNAADCARKVCELLDQEEARAKLREAARKYAEGLKPARVAEKHADFYLKLTT